jgi:hypothetical protein
MIATSHTLVWASVLTLVIPASIYAAAVIIGWRIARKTK